MTIQQRASANDKARDQESKDQKNSFFSLLDSPTYVSAMERKKKKRKEMEFRPLNQEKIGLMES